ncbi:hypothetical protein AB0903_20470 [Streptomyces sp. NPDC048389]|uniref:hypothetical protein n=1 Tax=Streptomyces sp. NPDC048389 TaxID=3154622 RepID=UPI003451A46D
MCTSGTDDALGGSEGSGDDGGGLSTGGSGDCSGGGGADDRDAEGDASAVGTCGSEAGGRRPGGVGSGSADADPLGLGDALPSFMSGPPAEGSPVPAARRPGPPGRT